MQIFFKKYYHLMLLPILSIIGGIWQGQYTDDPYHWGFIFSNALDLIDGRVPYSEIFIEYGIFSTLIHAFILILFNENILSLIGITSIFYSLSIFFIGTIVQKVTLNKYYSFFSTLILFMIYPWPVSPWINFISFFFTVLFSFFYLKSEAKYYFFSGISLGFAYLSFTTVYNFIVILFFISIGLFFLFNLKKIHLSFFKKNAYVAISFIFTILIFFIYLIFNDLISVWIDYQKIPFVAAEASNLDIYNQLLGYTYFLTLYTFKNFIYEPQLTFFTIVFFSNILLIFKSLITFYKYSDFSERNLNLFIINILIFSLNIYAQLSDIDKLATSLSLGIISLFILINSFKNIENKIIAIFILLFISSYSFLFAFSLENTKYGASRGAYFKDIKQLNLKYSNTKILYFKNQKWSKNSWHILNNFIETQNRIEKKCNLEYGANLTTNTYLYTLLNYKKIQIIPFFYKDSGKIFRKNYDNQAINKIQSQIDNENIFVVSFENNDELFNFSNYGQPIKIDLNAYNNRINKFLYIYVPKKCLPI